MKSIIILLLIGVSLSYNPTAAVVYARKYCKNYNKEYPKFNGDCSNFVSQCMNAGGENFLDCPHVRNIKGKGIFGSVSTLRTCLTIHGWKNSNTVPRQFRAGFPMFKGNMHAIIATEVNGNSIKYCGHTSDVCDRELKGDYIYYYK